MCGLTYWRGSTRSHAHDSATEELLSSFMLWLYWSASVSTRLLCFAFFLHAILAL